MKRKAAYCRKLPDGAAAFFGKAYWTGAQKMKIKTAAVLGAGAVGSQREEKNDVLFDDEARNEKGEETPK